MRINSWCARVSASAALLAAFGMFSASAEAAKNVILLISDGQGFNTVTAADYYTGSQAVYEGTDWAKYGMQTNSANNTAGYDAAGMASDFNYAKSGATDSASAASAMYTGEKIYDGQINVSTTGSILTTVFEQAAAAGKSIGAVSSVQLSHATPAAVYAHNTSRNNYADIAYEGLYGDYSDNFVVLMGAGNPDYDADGQLAASSNYKYVGGSDAWTDATDGDGVNGFTLVQTQAEFQALATGATPDKVFGVAQNGSTLQQSRSGSALLTNQPTLTDMTKAALNVLDNNSEGFMVMIEGGAVDWANHANQADRMIEEQIDFNNSVQAVCDYLDNNTNGNNWENTLVICTADHECGHVWGDGSGGFYDVDGDGIYTAGVDYSYVTDNGEGVLPGVDHYSGSHTNALVPLYAKGADADLFASCVAGTDANLAALYNLDSSEWSGQYVDNTSIYGVMSNSVPEPASLVLLAMGALAMFAWRIRRRRG